MKLRDGSIPFACSCIRRRTRQWRASAAGGPDSPVQRCCSPEGCGGSLRHVLQSVQVSILSGTTYDGPHSLCRKYAWGHDDLLPVTESYQDGLNGWGASISDALGTMVCVPFSCGVLGDSCVSAVTVAHGFH